MTYEVRSKFAGPLADEIRQRASEREQTPARTVLEAVSLAFFVYRRLARGDTLAFIETTKEGGRVVREVLIPD